MKTHLQAQPEVRRHRTGVPIVLIALLGLQSRFGDKILEN